MWLLVGGLALFSLGVALGVWLERADQRLIRDLELETRGNR